MATINQKEISLLQTNITSLKRNKEELERMMNANKITIACITETWMKEEEVNKVNVSNYNLVTSNREDGYGGSAIYIRKNLAYKVIKHDIKDKEVQITEIKLTREKINIVSVYMSPQLKINRFRENVSKLLHNRSGNQKNIITGDLNCHHKIWGNPTNDSKGNFLLNELNDSNLCLLHNKEKTLIPTDRSKRETAVDLTIISEDIIDKCQRTVTEHHMGATNHKTIITKINEIIQEHTVTYTNKSKLFKEIEAIEVKETTTAYQVTKQIKKLIKSNKITSKKKPKIYWNIETEKAWKNKNELRKIFNNDKSTENKINMNKGIAEFRTKKRLNKIKKFEDKLEEVDFNRDPIKLYEFLQKMEGKFKSKTKAGNIIETDRKAAKIFLDKHFFKNKKGNKKPYRNFKPNKDIIDIHKWNRLLKKKKNTAPGHDGVSYEILKKINEKTRLVMVNEINEMWHKGIIKKHYKKMKIITFPKANQDKNDPLNYRGIALIPAIIKMANSAVLEEMNRYWNINKVIPGTTFGFIKNRSINNCTNYITNRIGQNKREGKATGIIFLDLTNAYDKVRTDILISKLEKYQTPKEIIRWIGAFLNNRTIELNTEDTIINKLISDGLPQGDVLSPSLFNIYTKDIHDKINRLGIQIIQYADDFAIITQSHSHHILQTKMQEIMKQFSDITDELKLEINTEKTKFMIFDTKNNNIKIRIKGKSIEKVNNYKYLGLWLDNKLTFKKQIDAMKTKTQKRLMTIKRICNYRNKLNPNKTIQIHRSFIRSNLEIGTASIRNAKKELLKQLDTIQNQSLRKVTGCTKTTPIPSLMAIAAEIPLGIRAKYLASNEQAKEIAHSKIHRNLLCDRNQNNNTRNNNNKHKTYYEKLYEENKNIINKMDNIVINDNTKRVSIISNAPDNITKNQHTNKQILKRHYQQEIEFFRKTNTIIYTDGSRTDDGCGIGIYIKPHNKNMYWSYKYKLKNNTPITSVELTAIDKALQIAVENNIINPILYTDSKAACSIIKREQYNNNIEESTYNIIKNSLKINAQIRWLPGHIDIEGNEKADALAKKGVTADNIMENKLRKSDIKLMFQQRMIFETQEWYTTEIQHKGKKFAEYQKEFKRDNWHKTININANEIKTMNRILTGHDFSKYWLKILKIEENDICDVCQVQETGKHQIFHCTKYNNERQKYPNIQEDLFRKHWKNNDGKIIKEIIRFIQDTKISL